jgi:dihydrofolate reductase
MRRLISATLMSLDGVIGDPQEWASEYFDDTAAAEALTTLEHCHAMLMGRRTYEVFAGFWPHGTGPYAEKVNAIRKYVYSSTLPGADWTKATVVRDDVVDHVRALKESGDEDLVVYGHGQLGHTLLEAGLLDELTVSIHPRVVGAGTLMFRDGASSRLDLVATRTRATGVVVATYAPIAA